MRRNKSCLLAANSQQRDICAPSAGSCTNILYFFQKCFNVFVIRIPINCDYLSRWRTCIFTITFLQNGRR